MLRRRTVIILSKLLHEMFRGRYVVRTVYGREVIHYKLRVDDLYDFLYELDYDFWFLNAAHELSTSDDRALSEFIMKLHTGETLAPTTPNWTWHQRTQLGQRILLDLAEDVLVTSQDPEEYFPQAAKDLIPSLTSELELDGYIFRDGKLFFTEAAIFETEGEEGILDKLVRDLSLANQDILNHTLKLSETHYLDGKWDDCIANSRRYLEAILQEVAAKYHLYKSNTPISVAIYDHPVQVRDFLENQGLLEPKEKEAIAKIYGLMSNTGSHPYIAEKDQARLMRYLALTFAQFVLLRLQGALTKKV